MSNNIGQPAEVKLTDTPFYNKYIRPNLPKTKKEMVWTIIIILVIVTLCAFAFNQFISVAYKMQLLQSACELCESYGNSCVKSVSSNLSYLSINLTT